MWKNGVDDDVSDITELLQESELPSFTPGMRELFSFETLSDIVAIKTELHYDT